MKKYYIVKEEKEHPTYNTKKEVSNCHTYLALEMLLKFLIQENRRVGRTGIRRNQILDDLKKREDT